MSVQEPGLGHHSQETEPRLCLVLDDFQPVCWGTTSPFLDLKLLSQETNSGKLDLVGPLWRCSLINGPVHPVVRAIALEASLTSPSFSIRQSTPGALATTTS